MIEIVSVVIPHVIMNLVNILLLLARKMIIKRINVVSKFNKNQSYSLKALHLFEQQDMNAQ